MSADIPPFPAPAVEAICRELAEAVTGAQIPNLVAPLKVPEAPGEQTNTKWKRLFNAVAKKQNSQGDGRPLIRLISEVMQPVRFSTPEEHERHRVTVNARLFLYGYEVRDDGRVARAPKARTISEAQERADILRAELHRRDVHPDVLAFCRAELLQQNYFHAVLEATKSVADKIRSRTGLTGDGASIVDEAFGLSRGAPMLAFNDLNTDWERSEHTGLAMLCKGLFSTFRNPTAHAPKLRWTVERKEALDLLTLASMLHRRLDDAR
jgi:uncharacterized protein (TIGR02391 family)